MVPTTTSSFFLKKIFLLILGMVLGIVLFILGGFGGWKLGLKQNLNKKPQVENTAVSCGSFFANTVAKECQQQLSYKKYIIDPSEKWPGLITSTSLNFQLGGKIVKIEQKEKNGTPATFYTIGSHQDPNIKITVFAFDTADYFKTYEGTSSASPQSLKPISKGSLKVGDSVYVEAFTPTLDNPRILAETLSTANLELEARVIFRFTK